MRERTKQLLIVTVGVLVLAGLYVAYRIIVPGAVLEKITCADGRTAHVVVPEAFLLQYSGKSIVADLSWAEKLKGSVKIEDKLIQEAAELTQVLDMRLRPLLIEQVASACTDQGRDLLVRIEAYRVDFEAVLKQWAELKRIAASGDATQKPRAEAILKKDIPDAAKAAASNLSSK